jgi:RimJ/RimL family protein N-acetyltransferase
MTYEGRLREHDVRLGRRIDVKLYGMFKPEWERC